MICSQDSFIQELQPKVLPNLTCAVRVDCDVCNITQGSIAYTLPDWYPLPLSMMSILNTCSIGHVGIEFAEVTGFKVMPWVLLHLGAKLNGPPN